MTRRTDRINGLLRQEISELLSRELNDPRLSGVVSITKVETSGDLRYARVFVSVLASRDDKETVLSGISSASKFMRRELGERLSLRYIPELSFILDESLEEADHIFRLMDRLSTEVPLDPRSQMTPKDTPSSG
jgi:ribosome-binding factor A